MAAPGPVLTGVYVDTVCNARPAAMPICGGATAPQNPYGDPSQPPLASSDAGPTPTDGPTSSPTDAGTDGPPIVTIDSDATIVDGGLGGVGPMKDGAVATPAVPFP
jgi:hypothetical protein